MGARTYRGALRVGVEIHVLLRREVVVALALVPLPASSRARPEGGGGGGACLLVGVLCFHLGREGRGKESLREARRAGVGDGFRAAGRAPTPDSMR